MLIKPKAYPHPVLSYLNSNYRDPESFDCDFDISFKDSNKILINYAVLLNNSYLRECLIDRKLKLGFEIYSSETLTRRFLECGTLAGEIDISDLDIFGSVEIVPLLVAAAAIEEFIPEGVSAEYEESRFRVPKNTPVAIGPIRVFEVQPDHLADPRHLKITVADSKPDHYYELKTESNFLQLFVSKKLMEAIGNLRSEKENSFMLFPSIWQDTIEKAIEVMLDGETDALWSRALEQTIREAGIEVNSESNPQEIAAQLLFNRGWGRISSQEVRS
jgi:hypothetical protein